MLMHYKSCSRIFCEFFCGLFDFFSKVHIFKKTQKNWSTDLDIDYHGSAWSFDALRSTTLIEWYFFFNIYHNPSRSFNFIDLPSDQTDHLQEWKIC